MLISGYPAPSRHWEFGLDLLSDLKWFAHHMAWSIANGSDEYQMGFAERDEEGVKYFYDLIEPYLEKLHTPGPGYGKLAEAPKVFSDKFNANDVDSDSWTWYAADKEGGLQSAALRSTIDLATFKFLWGAGKRSGYAFGAGKQDVGAAKAEEANKQTRKTSRNTETRLQRTQRQERLTRRLRSLYANVKRRWLSDTGLMWSEARDVCAGRQHVAGEVNASLASEPQGRAVGAPSVEKHQCNAAVLLREL